MNGVGLESLRFVSGVGLEWKELFSSMNEFNSDKSELDFKLDGFFCSVGATSILFSCLSGCGAADTSFGGTSFADVENPTFRKYL